MVVESLVELRSDLRDLELDEFYYAEKNGPISFDEKIEILVRKHIVIPIKYFFNKKFHNVPKKILIIRFGAIGDVVHTTIIPRSIKAKYANVEIHYMTSKIPGELIMNDPNLAKVWIIDSKKIKLNSNYVNEYAKKIKNENFDLVLNLHPSLKSRYLVFKSKIKRQVVYKKDNSDHAITNFWRTARRVFFRLENDQKTKLYLDDGICKKIYDNIESYQRPFIIFNAGGIDSPRQGRTYPIEKWIELGKEIQKKYKGTIFITGINEDKEYLEKLEIIPNTVSFVGKLSLYENAALIKNSDLLISGDSGPLHIAKALGINVLGLYGSMPIRRSGVGEADSVENIKSPLGCSPCNRRKCKYLKGSNEKYTPCMKAISVEQILSSLNYNFRKFEKE